MGTLNVTVADRQMVMKPTNTLDLCMSSHRGSLKTR